MARSEDIARIQVVNGVRKVRLGRALDQAQQDAEAARSAHVAAEQAKEHQDEVLADAKRIQDANPACVQTRLWRDISLERLISAEAEVETKADLSHEADAEVSARVRAIRNHELKTQRIDDFGRTIKRQENRLTEMLGEDDLTVSAQRQLP
jgi:hypothetical protein